jgi:hypothetical protein
MADMERAWFRIRFRGEQLPRLHDDEDAAFSNAGPSGAEADFAAFAAECSLARSRRCWQRMSQPSDDRKQPRMRSTRRRSRKRIV